MFSNKDEANIHSFDYNWVNIVGKMIKFKEIDCNCIFFTCLGLNFKSRVSIMIPIKESRSKDTNESQSDGDLIVGLRFWF